MQESKILYAEMNQMRAEYQDHMKHIETLQEEALKFTKDISEVQHGLK
jgi:hypothetical protein